MNPIVRSTNAIARASVPARAIVSAGGIDTSYVRAGQGQAMLVIAADVDAPDVQQLIVDLAERFLVLAAAPDAVKGGCAFDLWLRNFLEGLGIGVAHVLFHASVPTGIVTGDT